MQNQGLTSNFPQQSLFLEVPHLHKMPAPRHIHLTCMLRMAEMTVIIFYRVTMDKVVRTPRITHLLDSHLGSCGC